VRHSFSLPSLSLILILSLLAACGPSPEDIAATANVLAATGLAQTAAAVPSPTPAATPSDTPQPSPTASQAPTEAASEAATATVIPPANAGGSDATPALSGKTALLRLQNNSGQEVFLAIVAPAYREYTFTSSQNLTFEWGEYSYRVWIGGQGPTVGSFAITNKDKHTLVIEQDKVIFLAP
jgi:hypothetical protein